MGKEVDEILSRLEALEKKVARLEVQPKLSETQFQKKVSVKEFLLEKKPTSNTQRTLVIGYYFEKYENMESFNLEDIKRGYLNAKERLPRNVSDTLNKCISRGFMMPATKGSDGLKRWSLTNTGERVVETGFDNK